VRAFILTQRNLIKDLVEAESLELDEFHVFQVPLARIEADAGIRFTNAFKALDTMPVKPEAPWTQRAPDRGGERPVLVTSECDVRIV
jgi:hypothetical protein